jgi:multiple antibiotic resistance protein
MGVAVDHGSVVGVLALLALVMALNWLGMIFSEPFMSTVGVPTLQVAGWVFAILQAALAVEAILAPLKRVLGA